MNIIDDLQQKTKAELLIFIAEQQNKLLAQDTTIQTLQHQLAVALNARFGHKSEQQIDTSVQADMFNEAQCPIDVRPLEKNDERLTVPSYQRKKQNGGRKPLPEALPRTQVIHDLSEAEKTCPCGCALTCIGEECSEQLQIVPLQVSVLQHIRKKYVCKTCELTIKTAALPKAAHSKKCCHTVFISPYCCEQVG